jgi:hypothetical protein
MRTAQIVAVAKAIEFALAVLKGSEIEVTQDLELKRAMEALVLALSLRMIGAAMTNPDAEADQLQVQGGVRQVAVTPGRAVVHQHRRRQPIAAKHTGQCILHGRPTLVGAGLEQHGEARVVVEHGQRMTAALVEQREVAFKVHLPQSIGGDVLEALPSALTGCDGCIEQAGTAQDASDGTGCQSWTTLVNQQPRQFAPAPGIARLLPQLDDALGHLIIRTPRAMLRPPRAVGQTTRSLKGMARQPFVTSLR